jgi:Tol biopolymer transport system component/tRNA A-37 threonylcarbamoyl transferase component Bud32
VSTTGGAEPSAARLSQALVDRYRIERQLGAGGMATVYLAEDLRHRRQVALKVLRPELAAALGPERFIREIEVAARLHHPHILPLYDSGEADGFLFYVMPYEPGQSLRERLIKEGELPIPDVVRLLHDVADALGYAHQQGLVHRDIKPENVLLSGRHAMVTDFGVAKAVGDATDTQKLTTVGVALGTPSYMAPEQAAADPNIDRRADIYALGVLGYELLTGRTPFTDLTPQAMLVAHLTKPPAPVRALRPTVPPALEALIMRCLEKTPADRFQSAEEMLPSLEALSTPSLGITPAATRPVRRAAALDRRVAYAAGSVAVLAALGWVAWHARRPGSLQIKIANVRQVTHETKPDIHAAISPDGQEVAYESGFPGQTHIEIRDIAGGRPLPLTADWRDPRGQIEPIWLPDSRSIIFTNPRGTVEHGPGQWKIPRLGGQATRPDSADLAALHGGVDVVNRGDTIVAREPNGAETIVRVGMAHSFAWRRDGSAVAYVVGNEASVMLWGNAAPSQIWVTPMGGAPVLVTDTTSSNLSPTWLPDGTLLFVSDRDGARDIHAVRLDRSGRPRERPLRLTTGLSAFSISVSADGATLAYDRFILRRNIYAIPIPRSESVSISAARPVTTGNQIVEGMSLSADGRSLVFTSNLNGDQDIYVMPAAGGEPRRVTRDPGDELNPAFSPDAREIAFSSIRNSNQDIYVIEADGSGERRLTSDPISSDYPAFSPDGLRIAYSNIAPPDLSIGVIHRNSLDAPWQAPLRLPIEYGQVPRWSPDGTSLVCEDGRPVYFVNQSPGALWIYRLGGAVRTVFAGGTGDVWVPKQPAWSADGTRIYFRAFEPDGTEGLYEISVTGGLARQLVRFDDPSRPVFEGSVVVGNGLFYAVVSEMESDVYVMDLVRR